MTKIIAYRNNLIDKPQLSVVIPAKNESLTIGQVITEAQQIADHTEVIVVCNGCDDQTAYLAREKKVLTIEYKEDLGCDVGRAIGAKYARGESVLFLDGDYLVPAAILRKVCREIERGFDIVLNGYPGFRSKKNIHVTSQAKRLLNQYLLRSDLLGSSMTTTPHILNRKAMQTIGWQSLAVPPLALTKAVTSNLKIHRSVNIDVGKLNKQKPGRNKVRDLIIGDHLEAIAYLLELKGARGHFTDFQRRREMLDSYEDEMKRINFTDQRTSPLNSAHSTVSVVISAYNEERTIGTLIENLKQLNPKEIIVVENGSSDHTLQVCLNHRVKILSFTNPLGLDIARAIGAREAKGDYILFVDGDIIFGAEELKPYLYCAGQSADIFLNNLNPFYTSSSMIDFVSMAKALLNQALALPHLQYSSLTATPHVIRRTAVEVIGYKNLAVPPKAQAIAALKGLVIQQTQGINVLARNPVKEHNRQKDNKVAQLILGDHLEAIHYAQSITGKRILLPDTNRKRKLLERELMI